MTKISRRYRDQLQWERREQKRLFRQWGHSRLIWDNKDSRYRCKYCGVLLDTYRPFGGWDYAQDRPIPTETKVRYYVDGRWRESKLRCHEIPIQEVMC